MLSTVKNIYLLYAFCCTLCFIIYLTYLKWFAVYIGKNAGSMEKAFGIDWLFAGIPIFLPKQTLEHLERVEINPDFSVLKNKYLKKIRQFRKLCLIFLLTVIIPAVVFGFLLLLFPK